MTRQPDFTGVWIKVERAKHHFRDLQARHERFRQDYPYEAIPYDEPDTGDLVYKAEIPNKPPRWWGGIVGDCVHNLRSSLDLLVCEMVRAKGKIVTPHHGFLISTKGANAFKSGVMGKIQGVPKRAVKLIKKAKPYKGADNPFWRLHNLDVADKHSLLVPIGMTLHRITTTITSAHLNQFFAANPGVTEVTGDVVFTRPAGITVLRRTFPLKDGAEIYRVPASLRNDPIAQMHMNPKLGIEIAFGKIEGVEGEPLIPTLYQDIQFIEGFIKLFPPLFSQEWPP